MSERKTGSAAAAEFLARSSGACGRRVVARRAPDRAAM